MSEVIDRKIKIYKLAKELNLASDTILEFLVKKGYKIKNHMSAVEDDMMKDIMSHFKKEKDVAEKHQRKIAEIKESKKKSVERKSDDVTSEVKGKTVVKSEIKHQEAHVAAETEKSEGRNEVEVAAKIETNIAELATEVAVTKKTDTPETTAQEKVVVDQTKDFRVKIDGGNRRVGLTVKGKIALAKPASPQVKATAAAVSTEAEESKKKKKKKKKVKDEKTKDVIEPEAE